MKKGQIYEGIVERIDFPNKGVVLAEDTIVLGKTKVIVKNTVAGQKVRFSVNKIRKGRAEGRLLEVLEKSPLETTEPACKHFGMCGGCTYQTISYEEQLKMKESQVKGLIDSVCNDYDFEGIKESPEQWGYRNKMEFSFGDEVKEGPLSLGMHKKGSFHDIITSDDCKIVDKDYNSILSCVLNHFSQLEIPFYKKMKHTGCLRHLLVRKGTKTGEILIALVTTGSYEEGNGSEEAKIFGEVHALEEAVTTIGKEDLRSKLELNTLIEKMQNLSLEGKIVGILHTINDSLADVVKSDETILLYGQDYFYEELLGLKFKISPFSFFQTNSKGAEVLYETAREYVGETKDKIIFDLYSGTGTIAQILAPVAKKVIGVEIVEEAVEAAKENASLNGLTNCEFIAGDVLKIIDEIEEKPDLIVLDPPRDGIHPKAITKIIDYGVDRIVYISCKPTSLVRDLEIFLKSGYKVERAVAVDMFPNTVHVESIILMTYCGLEGKK